MSELSYFVLYHSISSLPSVYRSRQKIVIPHWRSS